MVNKSTPNEIKFIQGRPVCLNQYRSTGNDTFKKKYNKINTKSMKVVNKTEFIDKNNTLNDSNVSQLKNIDKENLTGMNKMIVANEESKELKDNNINNFKSDIEELKKSYINICKEKNIDNKIIDMLNKAEDKESLIYIFINYILSKTY